MSQERILAVKKGGSYHVMAMQLIRRLDAVGAPYSIAVGRCVRAPAGLHLGLMVGGAQSYCVQTMRRLVTRTRVVQHTRAGARKAAGVAVVAALAAIGKTVMDGTMHAAAGVALHLFAAQSLPPVLPT